MKNEEAIRGDFWKIAVNELAPRFSPEVVDAFLRPAAAFRDGKRLVVLAPNSAARRWLSRNLGELLPSIADRVFALEENGGATDAIEVAFEIGETPAIEADAAPSPSYAPAAIGREIGGDRLARHNLRSNLRFENFVRGKSNELALVAAQEAAIGEAAPGAQGSLFIYGATGLGKTHLLQALGNRFIDLNPRARVLYVTANDFMNQVVHAYRVNRPEVFKARYQALDLLLVDDVQYLGGDRRRTQEEFFFLFNALVERGRRIATTCDLPPSRLRDLPTRITSRFSWGLTTHIIPPELELRISILHQKASECNVDLGDKAADFIARNIKGSVRELEGALRRVSAHANFRNEALTTAVCQEALGDIIEQQRTTIGIESIQARVSQFYRVRPADLRSPRRARSVARPRQIGMYLAREMTSLSFPEIGAGFGNRNHATVMYACNKIASLVAADESLAREISILREDLRHS